mgnify:CR=1 FL=1
MNNLFFANNQNNRNIDGKCPPPTPPPKPPCPKPKPPSGKPGPKVDFKKLKNNTCKSLNEVEYFLNNFQKFTNCIKLYKKILFTKEKLRRFFLL